MWGGRSDPSWMWRNLALSHDSLAQAAGVDAVATLRLVELGGRMAAVGALNSAYLLPIYRWASSSSSSSSSSSDPLATLSLGAIPPGHLPASIAAALSAYVLFGAALLLVWREVKWFRGIRHGRLTDPERIENYSVHLGDVPVHLRSGTALRSHLLLRAKGGGRGTKVGTERAMIQEVRVALDLEELERASAARDREVAGLERAVAVRDHGGGGRRPTHRTGPLGLAGPVVDSIEHHGEQLRVLNAEVEERIDAVEEAVREREEEAAAEAGAWEGGLRDLELDIETTVSVVEAVTSPVAADGTRGGASWTGGRSVPSMNAEEEIEPMPTPKKKKMKGAVPLSALSFSPASESVVREMEEAAAAVAASSPRDGSAGTVLGCSPSPDGRPRGAAFVTFADLASTSAALRGGASARGGWMVVPTAAPRPDDVLWGNVGLPRTSRRLRRLAGLALTVLACLFWTVPVTLAASVSNVESLTALIPVLGDWAEAYPPLGAVLAQLAPLLLVAVVACVPALLRAVACLEGHLSGAAVSQSLYSKLAAFTIVQTFLISAISGSIVQELQNILYSPARAVDLLAAALPAQSTYFMQFIIVQTLLGGVGVELLRIAPIGMALVRSRLGPNLTAKERGTTWMGLRPLSDPLPYEHSRALGAGIVIIFMVLFCYSTMAPITSYVCGVSFFLLSAVLRNQFLHVYPPSNDTGGRLWVPFVRTLVGCMLVAQIVLAGVLSLKKCGLAASLLLPLNVGTALFGVHLERSHYPTFVLLPARLCAGKDRENKKAGWRRTDAMPGPYLQGALRRGGRYPDNLDERPPSRSAAAGEGGRRGSGEKKDWLHFLSKSPNRHASHAGRGYSAETAHV